MVDPDGIYYLGPKGSFSHEAALKIEGNHIEASSISEIFDKLSTNAIGVVPVENTLEGPVNETLDNLYTRKGVYVNKRIDMKIDLVLASRPDVELESVTKVYSHNHAIHEARNTLSKLGLTNFIPVNSTSKAAQLALEDKQSAAICSRFAAKLYGLKILKENIQDGVNITRFLVVSRELTEVGERTIVFFTVPDVPGSLFKVLEKFYLHNVNLSMIYSRPTKIIPWNYYFYLEFEGSISEAKRTGLLDELSKVTQELKIVGSYTTIPVT
ncbi:prephenate dehydratase [Metallosphaera sedula]|uniref:Prephenate dehydratase n=2 Tax=Metallosphaera TaxID=41980 RepID=A0A0K1SF10_9CREN|nr:prephenate dehydratase [Metallosphaera sedula]QCO30211.1 ACT domain-containing protein [Metallosphaera prunae]AKV73203.1 prephenate dehydratase [Metallosphaera sedula]AKV75447.1 prephenate dehydratase [Metallosphaera sedula]AKV77693.1 prephenate dehydratase [Metallosphaera sedula]AKV79938.1 prephenate dehydratase [Metallosphaera sedula]